MPTSLKIAAGVVASISHGRHRYQSPIASSAKQPHPQRVISAKRSRSNTRTVLPQKRRYRAAAAQACGFYRDPAQRTPRTGIGSPAKFGFLRLVALCRVLRDDPLQGIGANVVEVMRRPRRQMTQIKSAQPLASARIRTSRFVAHFVGPVPRDIDLPGSTVQPGIGFRAHLEAKRTNAGAGWHGNIKRISHTPKITLKATPVYLRKDCLCIEMHNSSVESGMSPSYVCRSASA